MQKPLVSPTCFQMLTLANMLVFHRYLQGVLCCVYNGAQGFHLTLLLTHSLQFEMLGATAQLSIDSNVNLSSAVNENMSAVTACQ